MHTRTDTAPAPLWLALHFPHLALDQHRETRGTQGEDGPFAISGNVGGRQCVIDLDRAAAAAGIRAGMPVGTALSIDDALRLSPRDEAAEQAALERLAGWCYQYSSQVCIAGQDHALLLEAAASERLFGKPGALAERVATDMEQLGYRVDCGIAPTPESACLAAQNGLHIRTQDNLRERIGALPVDRLHLPPASVLALQKMGFTTAAEVFRLPRKALTRRLGTAAGDYLDRLLGYRPDPRKSYRPPDTFSSGMDLPETQHAQGLVFPLKRLVQALCGVLRAHDRGIQDLQLHLRLERGEEVIRLNLHAPTRSPSRLMMLLRERLERVKLSSPVHHIHLQALQFMPCRAAQPGLLAEDGAPPAETDEEVIERLQARLGRDAVKGLTGVQDHRPEHGWSLRELDTPPAYAAKPGRPVWLLPEPRRCRIGDYRILSGPERIETGWWDGRDCRRDYFIVRDAAGSTLWAFHEYKPHPGWYLHGLFS